MLPLPANLLLTIYLKHLKLNSREDPFSSTVPKPKNPEVKDKKDLKDPEEIEPLENKLEILKATLEDNLEEEKPLNQENPELMSLEKNPTPFSLET